MSADKNIIQEKTYRFALKIIQLYREMNPQKQFVLPQQLLKAGTSIGANVEEALGAQSRKDFISKMSIAYKEARETNYWLRLIRDSNVYTSNSLEYLISESNELNKILSSIIKTSKEKNS